jgi:hypothetical protein
MNLCNPFNPISRTMETTNHICFTSKQFNYVLSNKTVSKIIRNVTVLYKVPCILLPYLEELQTVLNQTDIITAIKMIASKYNITIQKPINNIRRYKYSQTTPVKIVNELNYFKNVYILYGDASTIALAYISTYAYDPTIFTAHTEDAKFIKVTNNNFITNSTNYSTILQQYFGQNILNKLPILVACNYSTTRVFPQFGLIIVNNLKLIYIPFSYNKIHVFYKPFPDESSVLFTIIPEALENALLYLKQFIPSLNTCS